MANRRRNDGEQFLKIKPQMLYNIVKHHQVANTDEEELQKGFDKSVLKDDTFDEDVYPMIYACATMWHETTFEMTQLLKSVFRYAITEIYGGDYLQSSHMILANSDKSS